MPVHHLLVTLAVTLLSTSTTATTDYNETTTQSASSHNSVNSVETESKATVAPPGGKDSAKQLRKQVDEMLQELRNSNHAVLKQSEHIRILSEKTVGLAETVRTLRDEARDAKIKNELIELKNEKKIKKLKKKFDEIDRRLDLCSCQKLAPGSAVSVSSEKKARGRHNRKDEADQRRKYKPEWTPSRPWQEEEDNGPNYGVQQNQHGQHGQQHGQHGQQQGQQQQPHGQQQQHHGQQQQHHGQQQQHYGSKDYTRGAPSGYDMNPPAQGSSRILVTAGSVNTTELLDLSESVSASSLRACSSMAEYPLEVRGAVGTFIDDRPLVCGGRSSVEDYHNECFEYHTINDSWTKTMPMLERRFQASAVMIDSRRWWITGGFSGDAVYNTTEVYTVGRGFRYGPRLPETTFQHCIVKVNASHLFLVGGFPYNRNAWIMDFERNAWSAQKPITHLRDAPHCARVERNNGKIEIVVAGGSLPGSELSTEIFSVSDNRWRAGPNLPRAVVYSVSVAVRHAMAVVGGHAMRDGGDLRELADVTAYDPVREEWRHVDTTRMTRPRTSFVAMAVPDYFTCSAVARATTPRPPYGSRKDYKEYPYQSGRQYYYT